MVRKLCILVLLLFLAAPVISLDSVALQCDPATDPECDLPDDDNGPICDPADPECDAPPDDGGSNPPPDDENNEPSTGEISDRDRDGVPDFDDTCPDTFGEKPNGCPLGDDNPNTGHAEVSNTASALQVSTEDERDGSNLGLTQLELLDDCVSINEVLWAGTNFSENHQYIELRNGCNVDIQLQNTVLVIVDKEEGGNIDLNLQGTIFRNSYFLIVNNSFVVSDIQPDFEANFELLPTNMALLLVYRDSSHVLSSANFAPNPPDEGWYAGGELRDGTRISMERNENTSGDIPSNWHSNNQRTRNGLDAVGNPINGTPRMPNSPVDGGN